MNDYSETEASILTYPRVNHDENSRAHTTASINMAPRKRGQAKVGGRNNTNMLTSKPSTKIDKGGTSISKKKQHKDFLRNSVDITTIPEDAESRQLRSTIYTLDSNKASLTAKMRLARPEDVQDKFYSSIH